MIREDLFAAIRELPAIDIHSHLWRDRMAAGDLGKVMFYHMLCYPLRAAGVESAILWPDDRGFHPGDFKPYAGFCDAWPRISNTAFAWALKTILRDLYGFDEPFTLESISRLEQSFADHNAQSDWGEQVLKRAGIERVLSSRHKCSPLDGRPDPGIRFTFEEGGGFMGTWEYVSWTRWLGRMAEKGICDVRSLDDLQSVISKYHDNLDYSDKRALVMWVSSMADFTPQPDSVIDNLLRRAREGEELSPQDNALLQAANLRCLCRAIEGKTSTLQLCFGVQFLHRGPHPVGRAHPLFASGLGYLLGEFPQLHFNILNGHEPSEPDLCALTLAYDNMSLGSFWWQMFYPTNMHRAWHRRLDMVPASRLCGFFSDGYCVDWIYGRLQMTKRILALVLSEKVDQGFYGTTQAVDIAQQILLDTPRELFLPDEEI